MRVYAEAERLGMPVLFHPSGQFTEQSKLEYGRPYLLDEVARTFPKLRIVIAQLGQPWIDETICMLGKHANVFADVSGLLSPALAGVQRPGLGLPAWRDRQAPVRQRFPLHQRHRMHRSALQHQPTRPGNQPAGGPARHCAASSNATRWRCWDSASPSNEAIPFAKRIAACRSLGFVPA